MKFIKRYLESETIHCLPGNGRILKITGEIKEIVKQQTRTDDQTTAMQLHRLLNDKGYSISFRTVLQSRVSLGWTFRGSLYCQLIRKVKKKNDSGLHKIILKTTSMMSFLRMNALFKLSPIAASVAGRKECHQRTSQDQSPS